MCSFNRAYACARTAIYASILVYLILGITFGDAANRAFCRASATADALVGNLVCHFKIPP